MYDYFRRIDVPKQIKTGIRQEREHFAKLHESQVREARRLRRARFLALFGWRSSVGEQIIKRQKRREQSVSAVGRTAHIKRRS